MFKIKLTHKKIILTDSDVQSKVNFIIEGLNLNLPINTKHQNINSLMLSNQKITLGHDLENQLLDIAQQLTISAQDKQNQRFKSLRQILMIIFNIALSSFFFGYAMVYLPAIDFGAIYKLYGIQINKQMAQGILVACVPIGGGLGAVSSSLLIDRFSRRNCLLIVNALSVVACLMLYIMNFEIFVFARLFQGFCTGLYSSLAPLIMKQLSPTEISGTLTSCHQIFITCGATFGFVFSLLLSYVMNDSTGEKKWSIVYGFAIIVIIVQTWFLVTKFNFQTPKYLLLNGQQQEARQLVQRIYKPEYVDQVFKEMKDNLKHDKEEPLQIQMVENNQFSTKTQQTIVPQKHLETPRSATIAAIHLSMLQQLCGVNAVVAYGGQIVGEQEPSLKLAMPILINMLQFVGAIIAAFLLARIGRKFLLEMGALTTSIGTLMVAIGFMNQQLMWILIGLIFFMACFGLTLGPVVWIYLPEVAQPKILSFATAVNWASCSLVMLLFPIIKQMLPQKNPAPMFIFFAIWSLVAYFFNKKYVIQTQNKGQKQIFEEFSSLKSFI